MTGVTGVTGAVGVAVGRPAWTVGSEVVGFSVVTSPVGGWDRGAGSVTSASRGAVPLRVLSPTRGRRDGVADDDGVAGLQLPGRRVDAGDLVGHDVVADLGLAARRRRPRAVSRATTSSTGRPT